MKVKDVSDLFMCKFKAHVIIAAAMRSRNFLDAAQAEKMREREAMENVKLLYHDNMIEMTPVSIASRVITVQYHVILITLSFVTPYIITIHSTHHINTCNSLVVGKQIITLTLSKRESIKYHLIFSPVGTAINDRRCGTIGKLGMHE